MEPGETAELQRVDAYADLIQRIIKKIRVGEENVLQEAIHDFIQWLGEAHLSMQNYRIVMMELISELVRFAQVMI